MPRNSGTGERAATPRGQSGQHPSSTKRVTILPHPPRKSAGIPPLPSSVATAASSILGKGKQQSTVTAFFAPTASHPASSPAAAKRLQTLHEVATLLQALYVRNANQHGGQMWWKWLGLLRKRVRELVRCEVRLWELRAGEGGEGAGRGGQEQDIQKRRAAQDVDAGKAGRVAKTSGTVSEAQKARLRLEMEEKLVGEKEVLEGLLRETLVPEAWAAFTMLVGATQFASLGLVLLGAVSDVAGAVGGCEQPEAGSGVAEGFLEGREVAQARSQTQRMGARKRRRIAGGSGTLEGSEEDTGQVIQRRYTATPTSDGPSTLFTKTGADEQGQEDNSSMDNADLDQSFEEILSPPWPSFEAINAQDDAKGAAHTHEAFGQTGVSQLRKSPPSEDENANTNELLTERSLPTSEKIPAALHIDATGKVGRARAPQRVQDVEMVSGNTSSDADVGDALNVDTTVQSVGKPSDQGTAVKKTKKAIREKNGKKEKQDKKTKKQRNAIDDLFAGFA